MFKGKKPIINEEEGADIKKLIRHVFRLTKEKILGKYFKRVLTINQEQISNSRVKESDDNNFQKAFTEESKHK